MDLHMDAKNTRETEKLWVGWLWPSSVLAPGEDKPLNHPHCVAFGLSFQNISLRSSEFSYLALQ